MSGGIWLSSLWSDLGDGQFDSAHLVAGFEDLNPANTYWTKHYNLFANVDTEADRYLDLEKWWGGFFKLGKEIKRQGQIIIYMVHENIGHLGIFVSGKVASKEHRQIIGCLEMIEYLVSGLYESVPTTIGTPGIRYRRRSLNPSITIQGHFLLGITRAFGGPSAQ